MGSVLGTLSTVVDAGGPVCTLEQSIGVRMDIHTALAALAVAAASQDQRLAYETGCERSDHSRARDQHTDQGQAWRLSRTTHPGQVRADP